MFKRIFVFMLALLLLTSFALCESWEEPALKNPQDAYEFFIEESDGSEQMLFGLIDFMNEERTIAEEHGAVNFVMSYIGPDGAPMISVNNYLQLSEFGNVHIAQTSYFGEISTVYTIGTKMYQVLEDRISVSETDYTPEDADWFWNSYIFPFGRLELMHGMRQDENGFSYFLIKSDDTMTFEYVTDNSMNIKQLRVYYADGKGNLELAIIVDYDVSEAQPLPQDLIDYLKQTGETAPDESQPTASA